MCGSTPKPTGATRIAAPLAQEAQQQGELERILRRSKNGAAADILTSSLGLPNGGVV
ncbi:MAG: hypothetical protein QM492_07085 [Rhodobacterales bacterium]